MDTTIPQLPYIPIPLTASTDLLEVAVVDGSSPTGYTSVNAKIADILAFAPSPPILPINEIAWGDGVDPYISSSNFKYINGRIYNKGLNQTSADMTIETLDSLGNPMFKVQNDGYVKVGLGGNTLGSYVGVSSIGALFMGGLTPTSSNYSIAGTGAGATYINGNSVSYSVNGSVKGITDASYTQFTQPFAVGSLAPTGANAFVVSGETLLKGIGASNASYGLRVLNSGSANNFIVRDDGVCGFGTTGAGAARIEVVGGAFQGAYIQTSGSIGVNVVDNTGYANKSETSTGTAFRGNLTSTGYGIDLQQTIANKTIFRAHYNGTNAILHTPNMQVGNAGLAVGDWYVDSAANILANADLMIGVKQ